MNLDEIWKRDDESGSLWFTGPASFTAQAARDRRTLRAEVERLRGALQRIADEAEGMYEAKDDDGQDQQMPAGAYAILHEYPDEGFIGPLGVKDAAAPHTEAVQTSASAALRELMSRAQPADAHQLKEWKQANPPPPAQGEKS